MSIPRDFLRVVNHTVNANGTPANGRQGQILLRAELTRGGFSKCRFARDGGLDFFTAVNAGGVGSLLRWRQNDLGELVLSGRAKVCRGVCAMLVSIQLCCLTALCESRSHYLL